MFNLHKYYQKHKLRAGIALLALVLAFAVQIKYWVYYSHDCLFLNPYQISANHVSGHSLDTNDLKSSSENCHQTSTPNSEPEHDHDSCVICQSYQHLKVAIYENFEPKLISEWYMPGTTILQTESFLYSIQVISKQMPRAPPLG